MRKKVLGIAAMTAVMTLATGMTAFAAGWVTESTPYGDKQKYVYDNGNWPSGGWFTDPETQLIYHLDPEGYRMTETTVEGYWLNAEGVRQEKTEEQVLREAKETAKKDGIKNPAKKVATEKVAASEAQDKAAAASTSRSVYVTELKVIVNRISKDLYTARTDKTTQVLGSENNLEAYRTFKSSDAGEFYHFTVYKSSKVNENAASLVYMYDAAPEADRELYNNAYGQSVVAMLGENEGKAVTDYVQSQRELGITNLTHEGKTDTGNSYVVKYNNNRIDISVICSEVTAADESAEETTSENPAESTETVAETVTSKTITVGGAKVTAEENAAEETVDA